VGRPGQANQNTHKTVCLRGHPLDGIKKGGRGRYCIVCSRARVRDPDQKARQAKIDADRYRNDPVYKQRKKDAATASAAKKTPEERQAYGRSWYARPGQRESVRAKRRLKAYGVTGEEFDLMLASQNGACAICGTCNPVGCWHLDHCHATGAIRGVLCRLCNQAIGFARDDVGILRAAIAYLDHAGGLRPRRVTA
jgi:hypothetical protein